MNTEASKKETEAYEAKLLVAEPATKDQVKESRLSGESTSDLSIRIDRAEMEALVGTGKITMRHVKDYGRGALAHKVRNYELSRMTDKQVTLEMRREKLKSSMDRFDYEGHVKALRAIVSCLNIDPVTCMGKFTPEDAKRLMEALYAIRDTFNSLDLRKKLPKKMPKTFTKPAKDLLRELGLKVDENVTNKRINGKLVRIYSITMDSAETMQTYLACRKGSASSL